MRFLFCVLSLFVLTSSVSAKTTKANVHVKIGSSVKREKAVGNLSLAVNPVIISYVNVTLTSDDASAVAANNGQWCIESEDEAVNLPAGADYEGVLNGEYIEVAIPLTNGKVRKISFKVFDKKWHTPYDLPGGPAAGK